MYNETALANAREQELLSTEVAVMSYGQIAELAEVELGPNGESPADFFYTQVRAYVVAALEGDEETAIKEKEEASLRAFLTLRPKADTLSKMDVYRNDDGDLVVR